MKKLEKAAAKAINTVINIETYGWPPVCEDQYINRQGRRERGKEKRRALSTATNNYLVVLT